MGNPQIDQLKAAPLQALRAVFTGIGRILMAADRPSNQADGPSGEAETVDRQSPARTGDLRQPAASATPAAGSSRWRSLDTTGNVRLLSAEDLDDDGPAVPATAAPPTVTEPTTGAALPIASYDTLSLPSIRARLRNLDADQLRVLVGYERAHAERIDVLGMLERRIEKLESGG